MEPSARQRGGLFGVVAETGVSLQPWQFNGLLPEGAYV